MAGPDGRNQTAVAASLLLGFGDLPELHILLFLLFPATYLATLAGNSLIVGLVVADPHLRTPMYFFLGNLSCLEMCYSSAILPRLLASLLTGDRTISVAGCLAQLYVSSFMAATECCLLAAVSYDRYVAICKPLHYAALMDTRVCLRLAAGSWLNASLAIAVFLVCVSQLTFCGPSQIDHFRCDPLPLVELSCSDARLVLGLVFTVVSIFALPPFLVTLASYLCILAAILGIPSATGRRRAFSTCSSHLAVVTIFYGTILAVYLLPTRQSLNKGLSLCYTVLTPLLNPLIYSLRNRAVRDALGRSVAFTKTCPDA